MLVAASQKAHHGSSTPSPLSAVASKQRAIRAQRAQRPAEQGFQGACAPLPPSNTQSPHPLAVSLKALPLAKSRAPALPSRNTPPSQQKLTHPQPHRLHAHRRTHHYRHPVGQGVERENVLAKASFRPRTSPACVAADVPARFGFFTFCVFFTPPSYIPKKRVLFRRPAQRITSSQCILQNALTRT